VLAATALFFVWTEKSALSLQSDHGGRVKQILQDLLKGTTELADVPCPAVSPQRLLIQTRRTLISAGTERMLVDFAKSGYISKARQQPEKVRMVLDKVRVDGLGPTIQAVRNKLDQPLPLGYCNVGTVLEVGTDVSGFAVGDRVASNGNHAEVVAVSSQLCARIPDDVTDDEAAFTVIGAIALQGIRLAQPTLGETVVVMGLGLIGQITVQLLRANGCHVLGLDFDATKLAHAKSFGADVFDLSGGGDPVVAAEGFSRARGVDAVIITASTRSNEPVRQAAQMCRKRGRIVLVGVVGLELSRADFYEKELTFQVSCSYGPGRYDPNYEDKGQDYPIGFVRWTEQRNIEAVLDLMASGRLDVKPLLSHRFTFAEAQSAYDLISSDAPSLGVLLDYQEPTEQREAILRKRTVVVSQQPGSSARASTGTAFAFIGAGNYSAGVLIPAFKAAGVHLANVVSSRGITGLVAARKFGFDQTTTDAQSILLDPSIRAVVIGTQHDTHAALVCRALLAGKDVFVEKPLALNKIEIENIVKAFRQATIDGVEPRLMVGFNRRFAPHVQKIHALLAACPGPKTFVMTVNAGSIPSSHWTQDPDTGGGRIVGEACHFIDLLRYLAGAPITSHHSTYMRSPTQDTASFTLAFEDGSIGTIHYLANGTKAFPKERLEVFASGRILQLDNFRKLTGFGWKGFRRMNVWRQDKGQQACASAFVKSVTERGPAPISFSELIEVALVSIELAKPDGSIRH
jgi:predicted dehydrogenase/threonine dehydrogenase-like Zn-dependent dehydrogenase